jgi:hypothetical protein
MAHAIISALDELRLLGPVGIALSTFVLVFSVSTALTETHFTACHSWVEKYKTPVGTVNHTEQQRIIEPHLINTSY